MGTSVRLPPELIDFLALPGSQSLLIRGPPGSGKTTLSLALLEAYRGKRILVSSRVTKSELYREFPWLGENGAGTIEVLETVAPPGGIRKVANASSRLGSLLSEDSSKDAELRSFLWLPEALQEAWSRMSDRTPTLLVVDSWDALIEAYIGGPLTPELTVPDRQEIERILLARMATAPVHLTLVLEREEQTHLDYLVNAVVHATSHFEEERLQRWLMLRKLRGVRIENAMYPFTLEGGRFESIEPLRPYAEVQSGRAEQEPDPMPGYLWPGSTAFATSLGRLGHGGITLLELDASVPEHVIYLLLAPVVAGVVNRRGPTLIVPDAHASPETLWRRLKTQVPQGRFAEHVRFLVPPPQPGSTSPREPPAFAKMRLPLIPPGPEGTSPSTLEIEGFLSSGESAGAPSLVVLHLVGLYALASALKVPMTAESVRALPTQLLSGLTRQMSHTIIVGRAGDPLHEAMRPVATMLLHLRLRQGRVVMNGSVPWTPNFLLAEGQEHVPYQLLRVV